MVFCKKIELEVNNLEVFLAWWAMAIPVPRQLDLPWLRSPVSCAAVFVNTYTAE